MRVRSHLRGRGGLPPVPRCLFRLARLLGSVRDYTESFFFFFFASTRQVAVGVSASIIFELGLIKCSIFTIHSRPGHVQWGEQRPTVVILRHADAQR